MTIPDAFERMLETAPRERLVQEIRTNIEALAEVMQEVPRWTPVAEGLPEKVGSYLVHVEHASLVWGQEHLLKFFDVAIWANGKFVSAELLACRNSSAEGTVVTHWMPLPALPQGDKETK